jgi:hypothetical protein
VSASVTKIAELIARRDDRQRTAALPGAPPRNLLAKVPAHAQANTKRAQGLVLRSSTAVNEGRFSCQPWPRPHEVVPDEAEDADAVRGAAITEARRGRVLGV